MARTPRTLITRALEDVGPEDLPQFTAMLREPRTDGLKPERFTKGRVAGKSYQELADLLVSAFSGKAVEVTVALLRNIDQNDVANQLEEDAKKLPQNACGASGAAAQPHGESGSAAQPRGASGGAAQQGHFVDRHRNELIERVSNINSLLDHLLQEKVLQQGQYDKVYEIRPKQDQMRFLFSGPLTSGGVRSKDVFLSALEKQEPYLMEELREKDGL